MRGADVYAEKVSLWRFQMCVMQIPTDWDHLEINTLGSQVKFVVSIDSLPKIATIFSAIYIL